MQVVNLDASRPCSSAAPVSSQGSADWVILYIRTIAHGTRPTNGLTLKVSADWKSVLRRTDASKFRQLCGHGPGIHGNIRAGFMSNTASSNDRMDGNKEAVSVPLALALSRQLQ
ncbi:hypothetical protein RRG08_059917 [Elysia crispata]|uniref:Uncharacterized protein n=1 Tax=Elysia crispata TaxID=231223 RepID=A0AAE1CU25_9GAST|nr:hypothetical protein RRG08_059917 [Elysia crispata]